MSGPDPYALAILSAMQPFARRGNVYEGTVDPQVVARRRAKNRVARRQRKVNRGRR